MVFENLTLFEIRLDDAQFGPRSLGRNDETTDESESGAGRSGGPVAALVLLAVFTAGAALLWRRFRSDDEIELAEPVDTEADAASAD